jgi:bacillolysin
MKKILQGLIILLTLIISPNLLKAQGNLYRMISTENGVSKHFMTLDKKQWVKFVPGAARQLFGLNKNSDLVLKNIVQDKIGFKHYRYYQTYKGYPVVNTMYLVHTKAGMITGASGTIITEFFEQGNRDSTKPISPNQAISIALKYMPAEKYAWQDTIMEYRAKFREKKAKASYYPVATKVWFCGDDTLNAHNLRLCYRIDVYSVKPIDRRFIFVDVQTGRVLGAEERMESTDVMGTATTSFSGNQTIHSDKTGPSSYRLRDLTKGNGIITLNAIAPHPDYTNNSENWTVFGGGQYALDAHFGVAATWRFYSERFNRNSINDAGLALISWVNDPFLPDNAHWDGNEMDFGIRTATGDGLVSIDITGHELTHGVTQYTSELVYGKESGAINESISDIMGKCVQFFAKPDDINWIIGNDMKFEIRSFYEPKTFHPVDDKHWQADTYRGIHWVATDGCSPNNGNDECGVHENSGIGNYMFYLLVNGGSGTNDNQNAYWVSGIGIEKAAQIIYRTETVYLTPTSQYVDWWNGCKAAATDLFGSSSNELQQVENAWFAIGFGNPLVTSLAYLIYKPTVDKPVTVYDGTDGLPKILFQEGDSVVLIGGGCVQTGGGGNTWKRFVIPQGPNSDKLYFCTVQVPGITKGLVPFRTLDGGINPAKPDVFTASLSPKVPANIPESERFFKLGYVDDNYSDNGYTHHDNGTGDQCKFCGDAFMTVIIYRKLTLLIKQHF